MTDNGKMGGDEGKVDPLGDRAWIVGDLSFAAFSLTHAECGEGVIEVRLGERLLIGWCPWCAALEMFGPYDD